ncbi:MAG: palmitoyltransferase akr1 [Chrysothrix sp. TS-e1954]|nr:MAG: palmitoyltransferase akr1 [Chrysothrix sp. TS-e1954]
MEMDQRASHGSETPVEEDVLKLARFGEIGLIQKLFDAGKADASHRDETGITPLHWAAIKGHYALCHFLIQAGADVNAKGGDLDATPVLWAARSCNYYIVDLLLQHGADPLKTDNQGFNLLQNAAQDGNAYQLLLILHQDVSIDLPDSTGHTSLMWAAYKGKAACVEVLLRWDANTNATDENGFTALHWSIVRGNTSCIQKLLEHGADVSAVTKDGKTTDVVAREMNNVKQWHRALSAAGLNPSGSTKSSPLTALTTDTKLFISRVTFLWPFLMIIMIIYTLSSLPIYTGLPASIAIYGIMYYAMVRLLHWAPPAMQQIPHTPFLAGIFAGTLFWVGVFWLARIFPYTWKVMPLQNAAFAVLISLCTFFYFSAMLENPGYISKSSSRDEQRAAIQELIAENRFDEHLDILPKTFLTTCTILRPEFCEIFSKDPTTILLIVWTSLQLSWVTMILFVQILNVTRGQTTSESMKHIDYMSETEAKTTSALLAGTTSVDDTGLTTRQDPSPNEGVKPKKKGCWEQWKKLLGLDTFIATAMYGSRAQEVQARQRRNPFSNGCYTNTSDFFCDPAPVFGPRQLGEAMLAGRRVDYTSMYQPPSRGEMRAARGDDGGDYEAVGGEEEV